MISTLFFFCTLIFNLLLYVLAGKCLLFMSLAGAAHPLYVVLGSCNFLNMFFCHCRWYWFCTMADDFSQSLTPPVSPFGADSSCELIAARPPCFCCSETKNDPTGSLSTEGYVTRGFLKRYSHQQFRVLIKVQPATRRFTFFFYLDNFATFISSEEQKQELMPKL